MRCPKCRTELEIFAHHGKEIYICPSCLSGLLPDKQSVKILKSFCTQEIIGQLLSYILDNSLFDNTKNMLSPEDNLACPRCKSYMRHFDFNKKLRFEVNSCINCGAIWLNSMQMPLVSIIFLENTTEDQNFKKTINSLYAVLAEKKAKPMRSLDEIIAPFAVISGLAPSIPVGDNVFTKTKPLATISLIIACIVLFILQFVLKQTSEFFALYPDKTYQGEWYRLISYAFLHGGIFHILGNMLFLRIFGRAVEDELKPPKYLALFAIGAVISGIFFMATTHDKSIPCIGASGAISAVIGAYLILFPRAKLRFNVINPLTFQKIVTTEIPGLYYILSWIIMNVFFGLLQSGGDTVGVAYWGHIGGFIAGVIFIEAYKNFKRG